MTLRDRVWVSGVQGAVYLRRIGCGSVEYRGWHVFELS